MSAIRRTSTPSFRSLDPGRPIEHRQLQPVDFEQAAASGTPVREIVGEDPVEFAEAFLRNYPQGQWIVRERERLTSAIDSAAGEDSGNEGKSR